MSPAQQFNYGGEVDKNQRIVREMVLESYRDISVSKGREGNKFFEELEKRYSSVSIT